jgi:A/G-specific adenine glycosylase
MKTRMCDWSASSFAEAGIQEFRKRIVQWYRSHGDKHLPWRNTSDGWAVLVATILLRKTTTAQVNKVYREFLRRYPKPQCLLSAGESEVEELTRPLGIEHQRAKQLVELAQEIVSTFEGRVPCNKEELKNLPGVGDYTASEVLLTTCGQPEPLLDRNMIRVIERVFGIRPAKKRPHTDRMLWSFAKQLVPKDPQQAKTFNYGVLDFARKVCTAKKPRCGACPLRSICKCFKISYKG